MFSWSFLPRPILALAPMAGYTDSAYRQLVKELCPQVVCFTELTSVDGILHGNKATARQISFSPNERPIVVQIFGRKPENFRKAARVLTELKADTIDINMGCPAKKIVSSDNGSALLRNPALAEEIVRATVEATSLPVSIKMRVGIKKYDPDFFFRFAENLQRAGAKLITVHGRTAAQDFSGKADWEPIYEIKKLLKIPVIGNGDIKTGSDAIKKLGNLDGIMIGRACLENPWIFLEILAAFSKKTFIQPTWQEKLALIRRHMNLNCTFKGEKWGMREMRKHFAHYIRGIPDASETRNKLVRVNTKEEAQALLQELA